MTTLTSLKVDLQLISDQFERKMQTVRNDIKDVGEKSIISTKHLRAMFGAVTIGGIAAMTKSTLDAANRLNDLSVRLGTTAEGMSRLQYAASLTGVSTSTLEMGIQRMTRRVAEAAQGSGEAVGALNELGLSAEKLSTIKPEEQFKVLADALAEVPNQSDKVRLAMKLLDSEGVALLQTLDLGSKGLNKLGEESDRVGNTISTQFAQGATDANAAMIKLGAATTGLSNQIVAQMGPALTEIANTLSAILPEAANFASKAFNKVREVIALAMAGVVRSLRFVTSGLGSFSDTMAEADAALLDIQDSLLGTAMGFRDSVIEAGIGTRVFAVETQNATTSLSDFMGQTIKSTEVLTQKKDALKLANDELKKQQDIEKEFSSIRQSLLSDQEAEVERYNQRIEAIKEFGALRAENETIANEIIEQETERHEAQVTAIKKRESDNRTRQEEAERATRYKNASTLFGNLSTLMNSKSKKLFQLGKAAAIANAVVNTAEGITKAWSLGPILGPAMAATVAAAGAVQIQTIKSQQFGGGGTVNAGTSGGAPGTYNPPQPNIPAAPTVPDSNAERPINLYLHRDVQGNVSLADQLDDVRDFIEETDYVLITSNSRNGQDLRN